MRKREEKKGGGKEGIMGGKEEGWEEGMKKK